MAEFTEVRPGQIISSALFNSLVTSLMTRMDDLEGRLAELEAHPGTPDEPVAITGFIPPSQAKVNEQLSILGRGFTFPPFAGGVPTNVVLVNDVQIMSFLFDSSTERLAFNIPPSLKIAAPTSVTIRVGNEQGDAQPKNYTVLPPDIPTVPPPTVAQASPQGDPGLANTVIVGQVAVVDGTNFLLDNTKMTVRFTVPPGGGGGGGTSVYQVPAKDVTAVSDTRLEAIVPSIEQVPLFGNLTVILSVLCDGNAIPGTRNIQARRG
jgi:hypothetical protein